MNKMIEKFLSEFLDILLRNRCSTTTHYVENTQFLNSVRDLSKQSIKLNRTEKLNVPYTHYHHIVVGIGDVIIFYVFGSHGKETHTKGRRRGSNPSRPGVADQSRLPPRLRRLSLVS